MTFMKSAAVAAIVAAAALGASLTAANAHGKKLHLHGFGSHHNHHHFHKPRFRSGGLIILSTSVSPCQKWWNRYVRTGHKAFLHRYRVCMR
jgi:hypothetical protein